MVEKKMKKKKKKKKKKKERSWNNGTRERDYEGDD
jgi:hypothetical protein